MIRRSSSASAGREQTDRTYRELSGDLERAGVPQDRIPSLTPSVSQVSPFLPAKPRSNPYEGVDFGVIQETSDFVGNIGRGFEAAGAGFSEVANIYHRAMGEETVPAPPPQHRQLEFDDYEPHDPWDYQDVRPMRPSRFDSDTMFDTGSYEEDVIGPRYEWLDRDTGEWVTGDQLPEWRNSTEAGAALQRWLDEPEGGRPYADIAAGFGVPQSMVGVAALIMELLEPGPGELEAAGRTAANAIRNVAENAPHLLEAALRSGNEMFAAIILRFGADFRFTKILDDIRVNGGDAEFDQALEALQRRVDFTINVNEFDPLYGTEYQQRILRDQAVDDFIDIAERNGVDPAAAEAAALRYDREWLSANQVIRTHFDPAVMRTDMSPSELKALEMYTTHEYELINGWLRGHDTPNRNQQAILERWVTNLDRAFENPLARLPTDTYLYRGSAVRFASMGFPAGTTLADVKPEDLVGRTFPPDPAVQSWAETIDSAAEFARTKQHANYNPDTHALVLYQLHAPAGTNAIPTSGVGTIQEEAEMLLPRGTAYRVVAAEWRDGQGVTPGYFMLEVEPITPDTPPPMPAFGANVPPGSRVANNPNFVPQTQDATLSAYEDWAKNLGVTSPTTDPAIDGTLSVEQLTNNVIALSSDPDAPIIKDLLSTGNQAEVDALQNRIDYILDRISNFDDVAEIRIDIDDLTSFGDEITNQAADINLTHIQSQLYALTNAQASNSIDATAALDLTGSNPFVYGSTAAATAPAPSFTPYVDTSWPTNNGTKPTPALDELMNTTGVDPLGPASPGELDPWFAKKKLTPMAVSTDSLSNSELWEQAYALAGYDSPLRLAMDEADYRAIQRAMGEVMDRLYEGTKIIDPHNPDPDVIENVIEDMNFYIEEIVDRIQLLPAGTPAGMIGDRLQGVLDELVIGFESSPDMMNAAASRFLQQWNTNHGGNGGMMDAFNMFNGQPAPTPAPAAVAPILGGGMGFGTVDKPVVQQIEADIGTSLDTGYPTQITRVEYDDFMRRKFVTPNIDLSPTSSEPYSNVLMDIQSLIEPDSFLGAYLPNNVYERFLQHAEDTMDVITSYSVDMTDTAEMLPLMETLRTINTEASDAIDQLPVQLQEGVRANLQGVIERLEYMVRGYFEDGARFGNEIHLAFNDELDFTTNGWGQKP